METTQIQIGNWPVQIGETRFLEEKQKNELVKLVTNWARVEVSLRKKDLVPISAVRNFGVPTIFCRVDLAPFVVGEYPINKVYEIEARPAGFSILLNIFPKLKSIGSIWENHLPISAVVLDSRQDAAEDTRIFSEAMNWGWLEQNNCENNFSECMWVRGSELDIKNVDLAKLEEKALAPVTSHGDKNYLVEMNLAKKIGNHDKLPWDEPFVIKPLKGSKCDNVFLWHPAERKKNTSGIYTRTKISNSLLDTDRQFILQPFIFPGREEINGKEGFTIWRIYFGYDIQNRKWIFAGGLWNWRPCLKVHGASDGISGPLLV